MTMPRRFVLATTNPGKIREIQSILEGVPVELVGLEELAPVPSPEETGRTFGENARLKALYYARATGLPAIAEDSGLEVDALGGIPGVQSARFCGESATYPERFAALYRMLQHVGRVPRHEYIRGPAAPPAARTRGPAAAPDASPARFVCHVAVANHDTILFEARGTVEGHIAPEPRGERGFGYDPIFFHPPSGRTLAEVSDERKREVSHRGEAFRQLRAWLERECR
jgi:XTP/dITP diphosphohydrolase